MPQGLLNQFYSKGNGVPPFLLEENLGRLLVPFRNLSVSSENYEEITRQNKKKLSSMQYEFNSYLLKMLL